MITQLYLTPPGSASVDSELRRPKQDNSSSLAIGLKLPLFSLAEHNSLRSGRRLPFTARECLNSSLRDSLREAHAANIDGEDCTTLCRWSPRRQARSERRLHQSCPRVLHDPRQLVARRPQVHVYGSHEGPPPRADRHDPRPRRPKHQRSEP